MNFNAEKSLSTLTWVPGTARKTWDAWYSNGKLNFSCSQNQHSFLLRVPEFLHTYPFHCFIFWCLNYLLLHLYSIIKLRLRSLLTQLILTLVFSIKSLHNKFYIKIVVKKIKHETQIWMGKNIKYSR